MAKDVAEVLGNALGKVAREAAKSVAQGNHKSAPAGMVDRVNDAVTDRMKNVSGSKGLAAGVGIAALAPLAAKGAGKLARGVGGKAKDAVGDQFDKAGGAAGMAKEAGKGMLPGGGGKKSKGEPGVGKGRRMPIQQDIDIGASIDSVYKEWTQYENWPQFMHRLENVSQEDDKHVSFKTKIWGISKEFKAEITEESPNERIKWKVTEGVTHTGVITFHELGPRLTRIELNLDVQPGSMIEKAARGMRHVKRAVRADMARFKAHVLMEDDGSSSSSSSSASRSSSASSSNRSSSSSQRSRSSSSGGRSRSTSSGGRKSSSSGGGRARKSSSSGSARKSSSSSGGARKTRSSSGSTARKRSTSSSGGRKRSTTNSGGRKRSTTTARGRSSSNGRSRNGASASSSSSNGRSRSSAKKRSGARS